jgi:hypothetical protein
VCVRVRVRVRAHNCCNIVNANITKFQDKILLA